MKDSLSVALTSPSFENVSILPSQIDSHLCQACKSQVSVHKCLIFLESENELLRDELDQLKRINLKQKQEIENLNSENKGTMWIIKEKDTEIRLISREKDLLQDKVLENRLEQLQGRDD